MFSGLRESSQKIYFELLSNIHIHAIAQRQLIQLLKPNEKLSFQFVSHIWSVNRFFIVAVDCKAKRNDVLHIERHTNSKSQMPENLFLVEWKLTATNNRLCFEYFSFAFCLFPESTMNGWTTHAHSNRLQFCSWSFRLIWCEYVAAKEENESNALISRDHKMTKCKPIKYSVSLEIPRICFHLINYFFFSLVTAAVSLISLWFFFCCCCCCDSIRERISHLDFIGLFLL